MFLLYFACVRVIGVCIARVVSSCGRAHYKYRSNLGAKVQNYFEIDKFFLKKQQIVCADIRSNEYIIQKISSNHSLTICTLV